MNITTLLVGGFLIAHGLIHASYASPAPPSGPVTWPFDLTRSWLLSSLGLIAIAKPLGTLLWILATIGFVGSGLGFVGVSFLHEWWRALVLVSAIASLALLILFWHPMIVLGIVIDGMLIAVVLSKGITARTL